MALEEYRRDMEGCSRCSSCKWVPLSQIKSHRFSQVCPSISRYNFHSFAGSGKLMLGLSLLDNRTEMNDSVADVVYKCTLCGACDANCKVYRDDIDIAEVIEEIRATCVENGQFFAEHQMMIDDLKRENNVFGEPKNARGDWAEGLGLKDANSQKVDVLFHAGCRFSYDEDLADVIRGAAALIRDAGVDLGIADKAESCCGGRAFGLGFRGDGKNFAEDMAVRVKSSGAKVLLTPCADCYGAFKYAYPRMGVDLGIKVMHISQFLGDLATNKKLQLKNRVDKKITYHDPCHLGRRSEPYAGPWKGNKLLRPALCKRDGRKGVYDAPRELLQSIPGIQLVEMERIREWSWCCGAGGGVWESDEELSDFAARERIEEALATGADALATSCPWCERNLRDAAESMGADIEIVDVTELVARSIKGEVKS